MDRQEKINEQIRIAKKANAGWETVICSMKTSKNARKESFGFHFRQEGEAAIGKIYNNEDGSVSIVEAIV